MSPGRELDALVAAKVMGCKFAIRYPKFSTDIAAAWDLVNKLQSFNLVKASNGWICRALKPVQRPDGEVLEPVSAFGVTAPHAICLVALEVYSISLPSADAKQPEPPELQPVGSSSTTPRSDPRESSRSAPVS